MKDYYDVLGVPANISKEELKRAFRILAQQYHPDKMGGSEERFKAITEAYRILSGDESRARYDREYREYKNETSDATQTEESVKTSTPQTPTETAVGKKTPFSFYSILLTCAILVFLVSLGNEDAVVDNKIVPTISTDEPPEITTETYQPQAISETDFPMNEPTLQASWYYDRDVPRYRHCFVNGSCTAEQWALAVYGDTTDPRGTELKRQADISNAEYKSQFPNKCVEENGVGICDLSSSVLQTYGDGKRSIKIEGNAINCVNAITGEQDQTQGNSTQVGPGNTYCVSDFGTVYIDPTVQVIKAFGQISDLTNSPNYSIPNEHKACIWTYYDGNGAFPYMMVSGSIGPSSGYSVRAFCSDFDNYVYIYSTIN